MDIYYKSTVQPLPLGAHLDQCLSPQSSTELWNVEEVKFVKNQQKTELRPFIEAVKPVKNDLLLTFEQQYIYIEKEEFSEKRYKSRVESRHLPNYRNTNSGRFPSLFSLLKLFLFSINIWSFPTPFGGDFIFQRWKMSSQKLQWQNLKGFNQE